MTAATQNPKMLSNRRAHAGDVTGEHAHVANLLHPARGDPLTANFAAWVASTVSAGMKKRCCQQDAARITAGHIELSVLEMLLAAACTVAQYRASIVNKRTSKCPIED